MEISIDNLVLYHYEACPFCKKVQETVDRLGIDLETRNTRQNSQYRDELIKGGGKKQVPCLRIEHENGTEWMYESDDIIAFLNEVFDDS